MNRIYLIIACGMFYNIAFLSFADEGFPTCPLTFSAPEILSLENTHNAQNLPSSIYKANLYELRSVADEYYDHKSMWKKQDLQWRVENLTNVFSCSLEILYQHRKEEQKYHPRNFHVTVLFWSLEINDHKPQRRYPPRSSYGETVVPSVYEALICHIQNVKTGKSYFLTLRREMDDYDREFHLRGYVASDDKLCLVLRSD